MDSGGWPESDGDGDELPSDGWVLRAVGLAALWCTAILVGSVLWVIAETRVDCPGSAGCTEAYSVPWPPVMAGVLLAAAGTVVIVLACRAADRRAVSSPHGRIRGRSPRLREGW